MKCILKIFSKIFTVAIIAGTVCISNLYAAGNIPTGDIGDYGAWTTEHNLEAVKENLSGEINAFAPKMVSVESYVPIEAKAGLALMNALSLVGEVLDSSLVRFMIIFLIISFGFWILFEAYNMITTGADVRKTVEDIFKKAGILTIWILILQMGAGQLFMWIMGPVITIGTYLSNIILDFVAATVGMTIPDTCSAIREFAANHTSARMLIDANTASDILCVPTRMSGFFYTAISMGWQWMKIGIGSSAFTFFVGAYFVYNFVSAGFKFALIALGVIVDLFLTVLMLPFTAVAETIAKTSYKGIAGNIFNQFLGIFTTQKLETQITRFINAAIYFVSLSVVVALCCALLSGIITADAATQIPSINNLGFTTIMLTASLVIYFAGKCSEIASKIGGSIDDSAGTKIGKDIKELWKGTTGSAKKWWKIIRGK